MTLTLFPLTYAFFPRLESGAQKLCQESSSIVPPACRGCKYSVHLSPGMQHRLTPAQDNCLGGRRIGVPSCHNCLGGAHSA